MTALEETRELVQELTRRVEKMSLKLLNFLADTWIGEAPEDYFELNGVKGFENSDCSITCSCGRNYKSSLNWEKHVKAQHKASI